MAQTVVTPACPSESDIILGEGKFYFNYGEAGQAEIGATRGGGEFSTEREIKEVEYDGQFGPTKLMRRKIRVVPMLTLNGLKINKDNMPKYFGGQTATDNTTYYTVTEDLDIDDGDYLTNVAFVGQTLDGKAVIIKILNPLGDGPITFPLTAKDEVVVPVQFTGHYTCAAPTTVPYEVEFYVS